MRVSAFLRSSSSATAGCFFTSGGSFASGTPAFVCSTDATPCGDKLSATATGPTVTVTGPAARSATSPAVTAHSRRTGSGKPAVTARFSMPSRAACNAGSFDSELSPRA